MANVNRNIIANIIGKGFSAVFSFIFVPFYLKYLGIEAYGLIGFFLTLQMVLLLADAGFSAAITREVALQAAYKGFQQKAQNLCRTFELIYFAIGVILSIVVLFSSDFVAYNWINTESLAKDEVQKSIILMGVIIGMQFPIVMYQGVLNGLQQQVVLNVLIIFAGLARGSGAVFLLYAVEASLDTYFKWQVVVSVFQLIIIYFLVWRNFEWSKSKFDVFLIRPLARFAVGMALISVTSSILIQTDKLILSKMLSLETFAYYSLGGILASVPMLFANPIHTAVYPRFTNLITTQNTAELTTLYHYSCQLLAVLVLPIGIVVIAFSKNLLLLWTGDALTANNTFLIASVLATGSTLLGLMYIPYAIQLASGWTSLPLTVNVIAIIVLVPLTIWLASLYGAIGAACVWVILNVGYVLGTVQWMHRRILPKEKWNWYVNDVGKPLLVTVVLVTASKSIFSTDSTMLLQAVWIIATLIITTLMASLSAPAIRRILVAKFREIVIHKSLN